MPENAEMEEKRGPGRPKMTESPEFAAAVAEQVARLLPGAVQAAIGPVLESIKVGAGQPASSEVWAQQLAMAIAQVNDQDSGRKRIPPETLAKWASADLRMKAAVSRNQEAAYALIEQARREGDEDEVFDPKWPKWQAIGKLALGEHVIEPFTINKTTREAEPVEFYWLGVPNMSMRPLNKGAEEIFGLFVESIGAETEARANEGAVRSAWISHNGLVIEGNGRVGIPVRHEAPQVKVKRSKGNAFGPGQYDPARKTINVLGTIAAPAVHGGTKSAVGNQVA